MPQIVSILRHRIPTLKKESELKSKNTFEHFAKNGAKKCESVRAQEFGQGSNSTKEEKSPKKEAARTRGTKTAN